ncbi:MAG: hypothetical protein NTY33_01215 [Candidatus Moranbacteria bacterium]|nr:hypothetical protein [Candidatus Moranbacteria bacterium]
MKRFMKQKMFLLIALVAFALMTLGTNGQAQATNFNNDQTQAVAIHSADVRGDITTISFNQYLPGAVMVYASAPFSEVVLYGANTASAPTAIFSMKKDIAPTVIGATYIIADQYTDTKSAAALATIDGNTSGAWILSSKAANTPETTTSYIKAVVPENVFNAIGQALCVVTVEPAMGAPLRVAFINGSSDLGSSRAATDTGFGMGAMIFASNASGLNHSMEENLNAETSTGTLLFV